MPPAYDMAQGVLGDTKTSARLTVFDCIFIAEEVMRKRLEPQGQFTNNYALSVEWTEAAWRQEFKYRKLNKTITVNPILV